MKINFTKNFVILVFYFAFTNWSNAQEIKLIIAESKVKVEGTSNLHDWHIDGKMMSGRAHFKEIEGRLNAIDLLTFTVDAEKLISGNSIMDNNIQKALMTKKFKTINYQLTAVTKINLVTENNYSVITEGELRIAGTTKKINQLFTIKINDKKISILGKTKINMTLYNIAPPKALLGMLKTGEDVIVDFKATYN